MKEKEKEEYKDLMYDTLAKFYVDHIKQEMATKEDLARVETKVSGLEIKVDRLEKQLDHVAEDVSEIKGRQEGMEKRLDSIAEYVPAQQMKLETHEERIKVLEAKS